LRVEQEVDHKRERFGAVTTGICEKCGLTRSWERGDKYCFDCQQEQQEIKHKVSNKDKKDAEEVAR
jgi:S-adenosylmethionine hydrolase